MTEVFRVSRALPALMALGGATHTTVIILEGRSR
jgi:hypothetical protein